MLKDENENQEKNNEIIEDETATQEIIGGAIFQAFIDFRDKGIFDIVGHEVELSSNCQLTDETAHQIYVALGIIRDKDFKTSRYLFVDKNGIIKEQIITTSTFPDKNTFTPISVKQEEFLEDIKTYCDEKNYNVLFCQNHPSGSNTLSSVDENIDKLFQNSFKEKYLGHIILYQDTFDISLKNQDYVEIEKEITNKINEKDFWNEKDWIYIHHQ